MSTLAPSITRAFIGRNLAYRGGRRPDAAKPEALKKQEHFARRVVAGALLVKEAAALAGVERHTITRWVRLVQERDARIEEN